MAVRTPTSLHVAFAAILLSSGLFVGCDNSVDPFVPDDASNPFFLHGFLDSHADTQFVRVEAIVRGYAVESEALDVEVRTLEEETGEVVGWSDSLVQLDNGTAGHLFHAVFRPSPGRSYQILLDRSDGAQTTAETAVPSTLDVMVEHVRLVSSSFIQTILWPTLGESLSSLDVAYVVASPSSSATQTFVVDYLDEVESDAAEDAVVVRLTEDLRAIRQSLGGAASEDPSLHSIEVRFSVLSDEFLDPEGMHVENGVGFFGSVGRTHVKVPLPAST